MKFMLILTLFLSNSALSENRYETHAKESWRSHFSNHIYCNKSKLEINCVENKLTVSCETAPIPVSGDMGCYELLEILVLTPTDIGYKTLCKSHPTY